MLVESTYTAESGHWYERDGTPAYRIIGANGKERDTTLRDARRLNLVPSVTTIIKEAAAPGLEVWKQRQVCMSALTLPKLEGESLDNFYIRVMEDSKEQGKKASELGTAIHTAVQKYYQQEEYDPYYRPMVDATQKAIFDRFSLMEWEAEEAFSCPYGFGGKTDLHCRFGNGVVLDVKGKEFDELPTPHNKIRLWYDDNLIQLAAYRHGLALPEATCGNVYVSRTTPGLAYLHVWDEEDLQRGWKMFRSLLAYWQAKTGYQSSWSTP